MVVLIVDDFEVEGDETFFLNLTAGAATVELIEPSSATVTIIDDEVGKYVRNYV